MMSPEGVLSMVSGVPWRGAFMGVSSVPQSGTGSAVLALAGLGIGSVPQGRAGVRRVPCGGSAVSPVAVQRGQCFARWPCWGSVLWEAEVAPMAARGICGVPYSHAKCSSCVITPVLQLS